MNTVLTILIDVFQLRLISPWMLIVCFWHNLVQERIQRTQARICVQYWGSW